MSHFGAVAVTLSSNQSSVSNKMNINNLTRCEQVDTSGHIFFMLVHSLVFLVGLLLNSFTLRVYFCRAQQQTSSSVTVYLKNLVAADFLISLCLPIRIIKYACSTVTVHWVYCNFGAATFYLNMYASILFMGYIAANRYLKIVHPLGNHVLQTVRAAHIISAITWVFLLAMTSAYILASLLNHKPLHPVPITVSCEILHSQHVSLLYRIIHTCSATIFLFILVSLVFFYYSTFRQLAVVQRRQPESTRSKKLTKSRRKMLVLVSVFCVCFVPYHLVRLPYTFLRRQCSQVLFYLKELTIMVSVLNVCLDPFIYFFFCKAFRAQLSLRRMFGVAQVVTCAVESGRRRSNGQTNAIRINRQTRLSVTTKQNSETNSCDSCL